jgi:hypothetical protein
VPQVGKWFHYIPNIGMSSWFHGKTLDHSPGTWNASHYNFIVILQNLVNCMRIFVAPDLCVQIRLHVCECCTNQLHQLHLGVYNGRGP